MPIGPASTSMPGMHIGMPDVCKTPPFAIPIPYPNLAALIAAVPAQFSTMILCCPALNLATIVSVSQGDDGGVMGGVISQVDMATAQNLMGSTHVFIGGPPATGMLDEAIQNLTNCPGATLIPSGQPVVMYLG